MVAKTESQNITTFGMKTTERSAPVLGCPVPPIAVLYMVCVLLTVALLQTVYANEIQASQLGFGFSGRPSLDQVRLGQVWRSGAWVRSGHPDCKPG